MPVRPQFSIMSVLQTLAAAVVTGLCVMVLSHDASIGMLDERTSIMPPPETTVVLDAHDRRIDEIQKVVNEYVIRHNVQDVRIEQLERQLENMRK